MKRLMWVSGIVLATAAVSAGSIYVLRRQAPSKPSHAKALPVQPGVPVPAPLKAFSAPKLKTEASRAESGPTEESSTQAAPTIVAVPAPTPRAAAPAPAQVEKKESVTRPDVARNNVAKIQPMDELPGAPPLISEPDARQALSLVGMDDEAETVWNLAINDANLPKKARQNLIEDLNEDGLSDPKHPSVGDLPLIVNRIELIEQLAPDAMDEVNFKAFAEAYKDLTSMFDKLTNR